MRERNATASSVQELVGAMLQDGSVTPAALLEAIYYAAEAGLFPLMRVVAALEERERSQVLAYASDLLGDDVAALRACEPQQAIQ